MLMPSPDCPAQKRINNEEIQAILKGCLEQPKFLWEAYACSVKVTEDFKENLAPCQDGSGRMESSSS